MCVFVQIKQVKQALKLSQIRSFMVTNIGEPENHTSSIIVFLQFIHTRTHFKHCIGYHWEILHIMIHTNNSCVDAADKSSKISFPLALTEEITDEISEHTDV